MTNTPKYWAVLERNQPDDWRRARGLTKDKRMAECIARRYRGARVIPVYLITNTISGATLMTTAPAGDTKRKSIEKRRQS